MHQTLCIQELLLNTFSYSTSANSHKADLAALARTCKTFKEPALDLLWEELDNLSPLARCLPEACCLSDFIPLEWFEKSRYYTFRRELNAAERNILRGYARRVRFIRRRKGVVRLESAAIRVIFNLAPSTLSLFPNLRSLCWQHRTTFSLLHTAAPSLTSLWIDLERDHSPAPTDFLDAFGDRCPHIKEFIIAGTHETTKISRQICRWQNLHRVDCEETALNMNAISHLASVPDLKELSFTVEMALIRPLSHLDSILVFTSLTKLTITPGPLDSVSFFLSHIQLPVLERLDVTTGYFLSRRALRAYWAAAREACPSIVSFRLHLTAPYAISDPDAGDEDVHPLLTFEDLYPCTAFSNLRVLLVNLDWRVSLTDADLLQLATPCMETITINNALGWGTGIEGGGITLTGLVQLLRQCPSLRCVCLAIDTSTFTEIPEGWDVSYPPREGLRFDFLDAFILPEFVPGVVSVFSALGMDPHMFDVWQIGAVGQREALPVWTRVRDELTRVSTSKV